MAPLRRLSLKKSVGPVSAREGGGADTTNHGAPHVVTEHVHALPARGDDPRDLTKAQAARHGLPVKRAREGKGAGQGA